MIRRIDLRGGTPADYREVVPRAELDVDAAVETVRPICEAVRTRGVEAIRDFSQRFDGVAPEHLRVPQESLDRALAELDPAVLAGLEESIARLRKTCEAEIEHDVTTSLGPGATVPPPGSRPHRPPPDGPGATGGPVRAGRSRAAGLQRRDERRTGADRRGALP